MLPPFARVRVEVEQPHPEQTLGHPSQICLASLFQPLSTFHLLAQLCLTDEEIQGIQTMKLGNQSAQF